MNRRQRVFLRRHHNIITLLPFSLAGVVIGILIAYIYLQPAPEIISPCPASGCAMITQPTPTATPSATPTPKPTKKGVASYYSRQGCLGCSETLTMRNGEPLDDTRLTMAYNHAPMNTKMYVTNTSNGKRVLVTVTDTGGFERLGRIADLSLGTKEALGCNDLCHIAIEL